MLGLHKANFENKSFNRCIKILRSHDMFQRMNGILGIGEILQNDKMTIETTKYH